MSSFIGLSNKTGGHGNPRISPRKKYSYMDCPNAVRRSGREITCGNNKPVRADKISRLLIEHLSSIVVLTDENIEKALAIKKRSKGEALALNRERHELRRTMETADNALHILLSNRSGGLITQSEFEREIFVFRTEKNAADVRLREVERTLNSGQAQPDFATARSTVTWLEQHWDRLTVEERAEALRMLVRKVTYLRSSEIEARTAAVSCAVAGRRDYREPLRTCLFRVSHTAAESETSRRDVGSE